MGLMKDFFLKIENLVWDAVEAGAQSDIEIYAYVRMFDDRVSEETVKNITSQLYYDELDNSNAILYNDGN